MNIIIVQHYYYAAYTHKSFTTVASSNENGSFNLFSYLKKVLILLLADELSGSLLHT